MRVYRWKGWYIGQRYDGTYEASRQGSYGMAKLYADTEQMLKVKIEARRGGGTAYE